MSSPREDLGFEEEKTPEEIAFENKIRDKVNARNNISQSTSIKINENTHSGTLEQDGFNMDGYDEWLKEKNKLKISAELKKKAADRKVKHGYSLEPLFDELYDSPEKRASFPLHFFKLPSNIQNRSEVKSNAKSENSNIKASCNSEVNRRGFSYSPGSDICS